MITGIKPVNIKPEAIIIQLDGSPIRKATGRNIKNAIRVEIKSPAAIANKI